MNRCFQAALAFSFALLILLASVGVVDVFGATPSMLAMRGTDNGVRYDTSAGNWESWASSRGRTLSPPFFCTSHDGEPVCIEKNKWIVTFIVAQGSGQICWSSRTRGACTSTTMQAVFNDGDSVTITGQGAQLDHWQLSCPSYYQLACGTGTSTVNPLPETVPFAGLVQGYFST